MDLSVLGVDWRHFAHSNHRKALLQSTRWGALISPIPCKRQEEGWEELTSLGIRSSAGAQHADHLTLGCSWHSSISKAISQSAGGEGWPHLC